MSMNADQRLLALEVASHSLNVNDPRTLVTRGQLVDRFNMLALPGTGQLRLTGREQVERKARYYTYEMLRASAVTGEVDVQYLEMLEMAASRRDRTTDQLVDTIAEVKLRLV
jgi:hypothetical protein